MPKIVNKKKMSITILDAAIRVFADKGYHAASVSDVAKEAGLGKGTLYLYFESKEGLAIAIVERQFADILDQLTDRKYCETLEEFLEVLHRTMDISAEQAAECRVFFEMFGPSFASADFAESVAGFFDTLGVYYTNNIKCLQVAGEISEHYDARSLGRAFAGMLDGMVLHRGLFGISTMRYRRMIRESIAVLGQGLQTVQCKTGCS